MGKLCSEVYCCGISLQGQGNTKEKLQNVQEVGAKHTYQGNCALRNCAERTQQHNAPYPYALQFSNSTGEAFTSHLCVLLQSPTAHVLLQSHTCSDITATLRPSVLQVHLASKQPSQRVFTTYSLLPSDLYTYFQFGYVFQP